MEDSPAGKKTIVNDFKESPKKTTVTNQSQWSFGWQPGTRDAYNRPNNSKGTSLSTQVSTTITINPASNSARRKEALAKKSLRGRWRRKNPFRIGPSGITIPKQLARPQWSLVMRRLTTARRTKFIRKEHPLLSPRVARNDSIPLSYAHY